MQILSSRLDLISVVGTYKLKDPGTIHSVIDTALGCNYRMIDTAAVYKNEQYIGTTLQQVCPKHNIRPEDIFITSKLAPRDQGYDKALAGFHLSLQNLCRSQLDLYLIHWPGAQGLKREDPTNAALRRESWKALEELHHSGKVKWIGVSNYTIRHLKEMEGYAHIMPHVLQNECHPALPQEELRAYCREKHIFFQAYSSLGCGQLLQDDSVIKMAAAYHKTPAQLLLKWALQQKIGVIPKASTPDHVRENSQLSDFTISSEDIKTLSSQFQGDLHYCWDPTDVA